MKQTYKITFCIVLILICAILSVVVINLAQRDHAQYSTFFVTADDDDSRTFIAENSELGYGDEDGAWALLQMSPSYSFGVRFTNVTIPPQAIIHEAYVKVYSVGTPAASHPHCLIYGDDTDDAKNFSEYGVLDRCGRTYTDAHILWNEQVAYSTWVKTPNLHSIIQELVQRTDWESGNALALLFVTNELRGFSASFQNVESGYPAVLLVKWELPLS